MEIFTRGNKTTEKDVKYNGTEKHKTYNDVKNVLLFNYIKDIEKKADDHAILKLGYEDQEFPGCGLYTDECEAHVFNMKPFRGKDGTPYAERALKMNWIKGHPALIKAMKRTDTEDGSETYYGNNIVGVKKIVEYQDNADGAGCYAAIGSWFPSNREGKENTVLCAFMQGYDSKTIDPATGKGTNYDYLFEVTFANGIPTECYPAEGERSVLAAVVVPHDAFKQEYEGAKITSASADTILGFYPIPRIKKVESETPAATTEA